VPLEDRARMGAREEDLDARLLTPEWRAMLAELAQRTRELFDAGRGVCDGVHGRLRWELRLTWLGGRRVLEKLERRGFDVFTRRPTIGILDLPVLLAGAANWPVRPTD
jgi:phytoene synthase